MKRQIRLSLEVVTETAHKIPGHPTCGRLHGHSYRIGISLSGIHDSRDGMFVDFGKIKTIVRRFDHFYLNDVFKFPSAENLARYLAIKILRINRNILECTVTVYETETACATQSVVNPLIQ